MPQKGLNGGERGGAGGEGGGGMPSDYGRGVHIGGTVPAGARAGAAGAGSVLQPGAPADAGVPDAADTPPKQCCCLSRYAHSVLLLHRRYLRNHPQVLTNRASAHTI